MSSQALFTQAAGLHQQGKLAEAERLYMELLQIDPWNVPGRHLFGVLRSQQGRNDEALELIGGALQSNPKDFGALLNYGLVLQRSGRVDDALKAYDRALTLKPDFAEAHFNRGVLLLERKRFEEALASFGKALALRPHHADAYYNRGIAFSELRRLEEALACYDKALSFNPRLVGAHDNRGNVLRELKRFGEALASYDRALALEPHAAMVHYNRGVVLSDMQRTEDAVASFDAALAINPGFAPAWFNRGIALDRLKRFGDALESYDKALAIDPAYPEALNNRGVALWNLGRPREASASYERAVAAKPDFVDAWNNLGGMLYEQRQYEAALAAYDKVLALAPEHVGAWNGRGSALRALRRPEEALAGFDRAIALDDRHAEAYANRAIVLWEDLGQFEPAVADLERVLALDGGWPYTRGELLHLKMQGCDWNGYEELLARIDAGVRAGNRVVRPFVYQAVSNSPADLKAGSAIFARDLFQPAKPLAEKPRRREKIRLGYLSGEFRDQATAQLMVGLYEQHDRSRFDIVGFDSGWHNDSPMRRRLEAAFGSFIDIAPLSDEGAARAVLAEEIDILVNLNGYFGDQRMGVFARRPAPLQVNYLGFPATLGAEYMDYIIADAVVIPEDEKQFYNEKVVWLPDSYQANDSKRAIAGKGQTRAEAGLPPKAFVFCNFNQSYKLTPDIFAAWMRILKQVPGSVLWLWQSRAKAAENLRQEAARQGIAPERLVFAGSLPAAQHLARLKLADLFLDSLPYNAHTTASDALWAGLPLLTCRGTAFPGRVAASLLNAAGLPELVTGTMEDYERLAVELAQDSKQLKAVREKLARNRPSCALFDTARFRRNIEAAYAKMWDIAASGENPRSFAV